MYFSSNIKMLRRRLGITQDESAMRLGMKRSTLSGYENNIAEPNVDVLIAFSGFYHVSVDTLLKTDLTSLTENQLNEVEKGTDVYLKGNNLRVLASTQDKDGNENIEMVHEKAKAGYTTGFADPEYISSLPKFQLPFLSRNRKYRAFQVSGDSMLPIPDGSWVTAEFVQDWTAIRSNLAYIILTLQDGIVFKIVENNIMNNGSLILHSMNPSYTPYSIHVSEIKEIWRFVNYFCSELPEPVFYPENLIKTIENLRTDVDILKKKLE